MTFALLLLTASDLAIQNSKACEDKAMQDLVYDLQIFVKVRYKLAGILNIDFGNVTRAMT